MGELVWDASQRRDHAGAREYFDQAVRAARVLGDRAAEGLALLRKSFVELYGERDPNAALSLVTHSARTVESEARQASEMLLTSPAVRGFAAAVSLGPSGPTRSHRSECPERWREGPCRTGGSRLH